MSGITTEEILKREQERLVESLSELIEKHGEDSSAAQEKVRAVCNAIRKQIDEFESRAISGLEEKFTEEEERLQNVLSELHECTGTRDKLSKAVKTAGKEVLLMQTYDVGEENAEARIDFAQICEVKTRKVVSPYYKARRVEGVKMKRFVDGKLHLTFGLDWEDEEAANKNEIESMLDYKVSASKRRGGENGEEHILEKEENGYSFTFDNLEPETIYYLRVKALYGRSSESEWSDEIEFMKPVLTDIEWMEQDDSADEEPTYDLDEENPRIATVTDFYESTWCTIIANRSLPLNKIITWSVTIREQEKSSDDSNGIFVGIAPDDINPSDYFNFRYGWYLDCRDSTLHAGTPHNYDFPGKVYGPRKKKGEDYIHNGSVVSVVVDTAKGEVSFILDGVNYGVAFTGVPLDKPLIPCVIIGTFNYSVELNVSDEKWYKEDNTVPAPFNPRVRSKEWDSITLSWTPVKEASFYQVEVNGSSFLGVSTTNTFTKRGLLQGIMHSFRVRAVKGNSVGEWSDVVRGRTQNAPLFINNTWKKCPDYVDDERKYSVDVYCPRIATRINRGHTPSTVIGSAPLPLNRVVSWKVKVLKSYGCMNGINVGVAPSDIDQNNCDNNYCKCGWYYDCYDFMLWSGPPHNYEGRYYGESREYGDNIRPGTTIGVVMDMTKGELSFSHGRKKLGVAYEEIPLDKPLVPCVLLDLDGDSVEFML